MPKSHFAVCGKLLAGAVEKPHLDGLSASINDFDFDAALVKLDEIAERCARLGVIDEQR